MRAKVVSGTGKWNAVELPGSIAGDAEFEFLGSIEELDPNGSEAESHTVKASKTLQKTETKKKKKRSKATPAENKEPVPSKKGRSFCLFLTNNCVLGKNKSA
jgi:hypothetical protein